MPETTTCNMFKVIQLASGLASRAPDDMWLYYSCFIFRIKEGRHQYISMFGHSPMKDLNWVNL